MMAVEGDGAIAALRTMMGATDPKDAAPGTIRGDFALDVGQNVIHGSDGARVGRPRAGAALPRPRGVSVRGT